MVGMQALIYPAVNIAGAHTEFYRGANPAKYHKSKRHRKMVDVMYQMMGAIAGGDTGNMLDDVYLQGYKSRSTSTPPPSWTISVTFRPRCWPLASTIFWSLRASPTLAMRSKRGCS